VKVGIIGAGVVGKATGIGLKTRGHEVCYVDKNPSVIVHLRENGFAVEESIDRAVSSSDLVMIAVPTPTVNGCISLTAILESITHIGVALGQAQGYKLVTIRSTVLPTTTRTAVIPLIEALSGKRAGADFGVCVNPEFLRAATALDDFLLPDRIVIGELDQRSGQTLESLYESFHRPILRCSLEEAELAKYAANGFLATKISYFNEIHKLARRLDINPQVVSLAVSMDKRIGAYGTEGGRPFDGNCLPKDTEAFLRRAEELGENLQVLGAARRVNKEIVLEKHA